VSSVYTQVEGVRVQVEDMRTSVIGECEDRHMGHESGSASRAGTLVALGNGVGNGDSGREGG
jgi:hypothetical protein